MAQLKMNAAVMCIVVRMSWWTKCRNLPTKYWSHGIILIPVATRDLWCSCLGSRIWFASHSWLAANILYNRTRYRSVFSSYV